MLSAVVLSQSTVSSSKTAKPSVPFEGWYTGTEDRKLVCDRPFAPLLCMYSLPRAPSKAKAFLQEMHKLEIVA